MTKILYTHNGQGHMDDYFGVAIFLLANPDYRLIRTRDKELFKTADALIDVGNLYDPKNNRFDHHQDGGAGERSNGIPYASAGLVWRKYGAYLCGNDQDMADGIERRLISFIDSLDTKTEIYEMRMSNARLYTIRDYFYCMFQPFECERGNLEEHDRLFLAAVEKVKELLLMEIAKSKENKELLQLIKDSYENADDKRIIVIPKSCPFQSVLPTLTEPLFVILPYLETQFVVIAVKEKGTSIDRLQFPKEWRGKSGTDLQRITGVSDLEFCHAGGFMLIAHNLESAKAATLKAISISKAF